MELKEQLHEAYNYSINLLSRRDYSKYKFTQKLKSRNYDQEVINVILDELIERNYLQEERYAEARIKGFIHKGFSPEHIQRKLKQEFVSVEMEFITDIYNEMRTDSDDQIEYLIEKKLRFKDLSSLSREKTYKLRSKVLAYLHSKGHCLERSKQLLDSRLQNTADA